jgi:hypothetical protein
VKKLRIFSLLLLLFYITYPQIVYANSSWKWLTARPWDLLPIAIIATIILETYIISNYGKVPNIYRVFTAVCIANLVSFLAPYIRRTYYSWNYFHRGASTPLNDISSGFYHAIFQPYYTVESFYLLLTLILEVPLVYLMLHRKSSDRKKLPIAIIAANIITTVITFALERIFCHGRW